MMTPHNTRAATARRRALARVLGAFLGLFAFVIGPETRADYLAAVGPARPLWRAKPQLNPQVLQQLPPLPVLLPENDADTHPASETNSPALNPVSSGLPENAAPAEPAPAETLVQDPRAAANELLNRLFYRPWGTNTIPLPWVDFVPPLLGPPASSSARFLKEGP